MRFNAWHYAEDHLWTGLVDHLFREPRLLRQLGQGRFDVERLQAAVDAVEETALTGRVAAVGDALRGPEYLRPFT